MKQDITTTKGDSEGTIESLIQFLEEAKEKGATNYKMSWSGDPMWAFKWFETYRVKSEEEIKEDEIKALEDELKSLKLCTKTKNT